MDRGVLVETNPWDELGVRSDGTSLTLADVAGESDVLARFSHWLAPRAENLRPKLVDSEVDINVLAHGLDLRDAIEQDRWGFYDYDYRPAGRPTPFRPSRSPLRCSTR